MDKSAEVYAITIYYLITILFLLTIIPVLLNPSFPAIRLLSLRLTNYTLVFITAASIAIAALCIYGSYYARKWAIPLITAFSLLSITLCLCLIPPIDENTQNISEYLVATGNGTGFEENEAQTLAQSLKPLLLFTIIIASISQLITLAYVWKNKHSFKTTAKKQLANKP